MYFIGAEGPENEMEITSETSVANTNGALAAVEYATPSHGNAQSMYCMFTNTLTYYYLQASCKRGHTNGRENESIEIYPPLKKMKVTKDNEDDSTQETVVVSATAGMYMYTLIHTHY